MLLAFDGSKRTVDKNGYMHVDSCHITKECVSPYRGFEIPKWQELGLEADKVYKAYRSGAELEKAVSTFNGLPLLLTHKADNADNPQREVRVGSVGTSAVWQKPYINNVISITDKEAIDAVNDGSYKELSAAYYYTPDFTEGEFEGEAYDFIMKDIKGAHVALVQKGRAGSDVAVADSAQNIKNIKIITGNETEPHFQLKRSKPMQKRRKHLALSKITLAMDESPEVEKLEGHLEAALQAVNKIEEAEGSGKLSKDEDKNAMIEAILSEHFKDVDDATKSKIKATLTELANGTSVTDEGNEPKEPKKDNEGKKPAINEDCKKAMDKVGLDSDNEKDQKAFAEGIKYAEGLKKGETPTIKKEPAGAEDTAMIRSNLKEDMKRLHDAALICKPLIGTIENPFAFDSAEDIYAKALELSDVTIVGYPKSAYKGMVEMLIKNTQSKPAFDAGLTSSAELDDRFKHLKNIEINRG